MEFFNSAIEVLQTLVVALVDLLQIYTIPTLKQKKRGKTPKVWGLIYF